MTNQCPRRFKITKDGASSGGHLANTIVYDFLLCDYGLASDDTRIMRAPHRSVTLDPGGGYPSFTVRESALEEIKGQP